MNRNRVRCCKDCKIRNVGCYSTCETYLAEKERIEQENEAIYKAKEMDYFLKRKHKRR